MKTIATNDVLTDIVYLGYRGAAKKLQLSFTSLRRTVTENLDTFIKIGGSVRGERKPKAVDDTVLRCKGARYYLGGNLVKDGTIGRYIGSDNADPQSVWFQPVGAPGVCIPLSPLDAYRLLICQKFHSSKNITAGWKSGELVFEVE